MELLNSKNSEELKHYFEQQLDINTKSIRQTSKELINSVREAENEIKNKAAKT